MRHLAKQFEFPFVKSFHQVIKDNPFTNKKFYVIDNNDCIYYDIGDDGKFPESDPWGQPWPEDFKLEMHAFGRGGSWQIHCKKDGLKIRCCASNLKV